MITRVLALALCLASPVGMLSLHAEDWKTTDGKTYQDVSVIKTEPDAVTIRHHDGGARVPLRVLVPQLQKRFNYDPNTAAQAEAARAQADEANNRALQEEMDEVAARKLAQRCALNPNPPLSTTSDTISTATSANNDSNHHTMDELVDTKKRLRDDHDDDTNHYSVGGLKRDAHSLAPDTGDSNHHAEGELFHPGSNLD